MFRLSLEEATAPWFLFEQLVLRHPYTVFQEKVIEAYAPYADLAERYSKIVNRPIEVLTKEYVRDHLQIADQNVALLKNAMELWRTARSTSDAVLPMLYHYSWHCFNSFFVYTFFRWEPPHASSHGVKVIPSDDLAEIKIRISHTEKSLFQRLLDTWTLLGVPLVFSRFLPVLQDKKMKFVPNSNYLPKFNEKQNYGEISLPELLAFSSDVFENTLYSQDEKRELFGLAYRYGISSPNMTLKSYLVFFVASTLARYRPVVWHSILAGENAEKSNFALRSLEALLDYTIGTSIPQNGLLLQISYLFRDIKEKTFKFLDRDGNLLKNL